MLNSFSPSIERNMASSMCGSLLSSGARREKEELGERGARREKEELVPDQEPRR